MAERLRATNRAPGVYALDASNEPLERSSKRLSVSERYARLEKETKMRIKNLLTDSNIKAKIMA